MPGSPRSVLQAAESQWIFSEEELKRTPSALDGMSPDQERESRGKGVNFIVQVGIQLKLPQLTLASASVFLHRFFMRHTMVDKPGRPGFHYYAIAATSLFLATKVEENCRKMKELVIACCRVAQKNPNLIIDEQSKEYWRWRDTILHNEDLLLEAVCFDLSLDLPYRTFFELLKQNHSENNKTLRNAGWAFLNDSNMTMLCLLYPSRTIAAAALYCAAKHCKVSFSDDPKGRPWWEAGGVSLGDIRKACNYMASVYQANPLKNLDSIYSRTPEDGDPLFAKTRARGISSPLSPSPHPTTSNDLTTGEHLATHGLTTRDSEPPRERGVSQNGSKRRRGADEDDSEKADKTTINSDNLMALDGAHDAEASNGAEEERGRKRLKLQDESPRSDTKQKLPVRPQNGTKVEPAEDIGSEEGELES